ncbi:MAG: hypothetical protein WC648_01825 [Candidatus Paceibacterota bacterium]|jgi:hypothetical protein
MNTNDKCLIEATDDLKELSEALKAVRASGVDEMHIQLIESRLSYEFADGLMAIELCKAIKSPLDQLIRECDYIMIRDSWVWAELKMIHDVLEPLLGSLKHTKDLLDPNNHHHISVIHPLNGVVQPNNVAHLDHY